jgi:hypothetical protein
MTAAAPPAFPWQPGSNGAGLLRWFVWRRLPGCAQEQLRDRRGQVRRFGSFFTARRAARLANAG